MTEQLERAFELLKQQDEATQNGIAQAILDFIDTITPELEEEVEADEELEWLSAMTDEQYHALQRWLTDRTASRITEGHLECDMLGHESA